LRVQLAATHDAIVLAGRRSGEDPFAELAARSADPREKHRALIDVAGEPMLQRVVATLRAHPRIGRICISIDSPELLTTAGPLREWIEAGAVQVRRSAASPSRSALEALAELSSSAAGKPILVTTADHALLDAAILDAFLAGADASAADVAVGFVTERVLRAAYPESQRTYLRFRDESVSGANLFALRTERSRLAVEFWQRLEHLRKQPWRLVSTFGIVTLVGYATRRLTLERAFERASDVIGVRCAPVPLPMAEAAIDVDRPADLELVERILSSRRTRP
jgi:GTP:adenosylcobinamide-phosphate guanylyltransferase